MLRLIASAGKFVCNAVNAREWFSGFIWRARMRTTQGVFSVFESWASAILEHRATAAIAIDENFTGIYKSPIEIILSISDI